MNEISRQRLIKERESISSANMCIDRKLSIEQFVYSFIANKFERSVIETWEESALTIEYAQVLILIQAEVQKNSIVVEQGRYEVEVNEKFLKYFEKYPFDLIASFFYWDKFNRGLKGYYIDKRYLDKLLDKVVKSDDAKTPNKKIVQLGKERIWEIVDQLTLKELVEALAATHGKKAMKWLIKSKMSQREFRHLFPNDHDYKNRWDFVKKDVKKKALRMCENLKKN